MHQRKRMFMHGRQVQLPIYQPDCVSVANFLQRVPALPQHPEKKKPMRPEESENRKHCLLEAGNTPNMPSNLKKSTSQSTPRIMPTMKEAEIVFEEKGLRSPEDRELDAFLQRLEKHTSISRPPKYVTEEKPMSMKTLETEAKPVEIGKVLNTVDAPGVSLQELKTQLHKQIKIMRGVSHMEAVIKHRLENEDLDDEEEYFTDEYGSNIEDESSEEESVDEDCEEENLDDYKKQSELVTEISRNDRSDIQRSASDVPLLSQSCFDGNTNTSAPSGCNSLDLFPEQSASFDNDFTGPVSYECKNEKDNSRLAEVGDKAVPDTMENLNLTLDENTQFSQVLDSQGYFNPRKATLKEVSTGFSLFKESEFVMPMLKRPSNDIQSLMSDVSSHSLPYKSGFEKAGHSQDLLDLCSGNFDDSLLVEPLPSKPGSVLGKLLDQHNEQEPESQIMVELCSGTFGSTAESSSSIPSTIERPEEYYGQPDMEFQFGKGIRDLLKPKAAIGTQDMENPVQCSGKRDGSQCSEEEIFTGLESDGFKQGSDDRDDESCGDSENGDQELSHCMEDKEEDDDVSGYCGKSQKRFSKAQFYEEEAELSGSDVGDDEDDLDLGSEMDEYESDSDVEDLPSHRKLKAQVHRAHMKATLAKDKQELRIIQEQLCEDADMLAGGYSRKRNYRWRNIDTAITEARHSDESDVEDSEEMELPSPTDYQKKIERLARNDFFHKEKNVEREVMLDENSQSILNIIKNRKPDSDQEESHHLQSSAFKRQGSFLDRNQSTLMRLSSLTSNQSKPHAPSKSFVFQANSTKRSSVSLSSEKVHCIGSTVNQPHLKRVKLDVNTPSLSILSSL